MLAADEHPGAFLEDELPFAPRPAEPHPGPTPGGDDPGGWFQRWRVPITALFVVLIVLAVALAFGAKPDDPPARVPLGSAPAGIVAPAGTATTGPPADPLGSVVSPPSAVELETPDTSAAGPVTASSLPVPTPSLPVPASTSAPGTATPGAPATSTPATTTQATTTPATGPPAPAASPTAGGPGPTRPPTTRPPATATTVPGYATGPTQARGPNEPPFIANPGLVVTTAGQAVRYQIGVSARPGEVLAFSATGLPRGLSIDPATGVVTGTTPAPETSGVQVTVVGTGGSTFTQGFTWVVTR